MRALRLYPQGLVLEEVARPEPGPGEVLVRVHAAAITRDELTWPVDRLPAIPSYELAGVVEASGEGVMALTPFDRDGVAADYAVVPETLLAPRPAGLSDEQAAALPMPALSAWQGLVVHGRLQPGERVLVTGARGGVGHVAVQLVRALGGALVEEGEACDLLFDTTGGKALARSADQAGRVVTIAAEARAPSISWWSRTARSSPHCPSCGRRLTPYSRWRTSAQRSSAAQRAVSTGKLSCASPHSQARKPACSPRSTAASGS
jgi:NADPH:quinone reductase-like Zn-dependent oxidoreductase